MPVRVGEARVLASVTVAAGGGIVEDVPGQSRDGLDVSSDQLTEMNLDGLDPLVELHEIWITRPRRLEVTGRPEVLVETLSDEVTSCAEERDVVLRVEQARIVGTHCVRWKACRSRRIRPPGKSLVACPGGSGWSPR